jgi:hypothetical protein
MFGRQDSLLSASTVLYINRYDSGNLVADLNNSTSMTYMNMHVPGTAR